jgi:uncharacterized protein
MDEIIEHEDHGHRGAFFITRDGKRIAEMAYARIGSSHVIIDHTQVDPALRGHGVAHSLLDAAVQWARTSNTKISATCSYAVARFARDASIGDVLG